MKIYCANCGAERHEGDNKCSSCGVEFTDTYAMTEDSETERGLICGTGLIETEDDLINKKHLIYGGSVIGGLLVLGGLYKIFRK